MVESKKPRRAPAAPTPAKTKTKAATEFRRFQEARAAAGVEANATSMGSTTDPSTTGTSSPGLPPWPSPPSFSLPQIPQMPHGWAGMLPQPGMVQPAPLAVGPLGDRLGSTLRLGIDVINMALAGSLRLLGGGGWGGHAQCHGGNHGHHGGCCDPCGGHDCCEVFEHEGCCNASVGTCCD